GSGFGESIQLATKKQAEGLDLTVLASDADIPKEATSARVAVIPSDLAVNPPENLRAFLAAFDGRVIVAPVESPRLIWAGGAGREPAGQAALILRQLSEGQEVRQSASGASAWMVVTYIFAALFGLEVLMFLLSLGVSLVMN
ncbi:MAG: hypothetical protein COS37_08145, partial [Anaerolineae bacterium CG03_land_8_20_14_0_80_58_20]